jgi:thioredoxin reductase (NADPH)
MSDFLYDLIIIGAGPAGLAAGLYGSRGGLKTLILEKGIVGGQLQVTEEIENYPGMDHMTGPQISDELEKQTRRFGCQIITNCAVESLDFNTQPRLIKTNKGEFFAKSVIIASGSSHNKLGVPGEEELTGKGVSYCAICDGAFFKEREVVVIGGGNSAVEEGNFLTKFAKKVTLIHRRDKLRAEKLVQERFLKNPKTEVIWNTVVERINGDLLGVKSVTIQNIISNETQDLPTDGVFIYVGLTPNTEYLQGHVELDESKKVKSDERLKTNISGIFVAGDVRNTPLRQAITAASDGSIAATEAIAFVENLEN